MTARQRHRNRTRTLQECRRHGVIGRPAVVYTNLMHPAPVRARRVPYAVKVWRRMAQALLRNVRAWSVSYDGVTS